MDKRDKRILRKLGHPILNIGINEDVVKDLRKDSMDARSVRPAYFPVIEKKL